MIKPHIAAFDGSLELRFWKCTKHTVVCSNHFKYGRPTNASPIPTLYLKGYESDIKEVKLPRRVLKRVASWETSVEPYKKRKENIVHTAESTSTSGPSAVLQENTDSNTHVYNVVCLSLIQFHVYPKIMWTAQMQQI